MNRQKKYLPSFVKRLGRITAAQKANLNDLNLYKTKIKDLKNKNIIYAFGHQHLGWTLGAITGKIISGIVAGEKTNLNLAPYSSKRFN